MCLGGGLDDFTKRTGRLQHMLVEQGKLQSFLYAEFEYSVLLYIKVIQRLHDLQLTLKGGVESMLLHYCPEVKSVEEVISSDIEEASQSQLKFVEEMTRSGGD